jgi:hypothetical protein
MRRLIYIAFIFIEIFLFGFRPFINPISIKGHIRPNSIDSSLYIGYLSVFVKGDSKILARATTNEKGKFNLSFTPGKEKSFDFYCAGIGVDTIILASFTKFESDNPEMTFFIPSIVKRNALGRAICPKCHKADKVYKIEYSDSPVTTVHINKSGDTIYSQIYRGVYQESCVVKAAKFYCDRDRVKF